MSVVAATARVLGHMLKQRGPGGGNCDSRQINPGGCPRKMGAA